jgi:protein pelota
MGGKVFIFSSLHTTGEQLSNLTGVAAILHFAMPDLEELDDSQ